jgi:hypothetical protein
MIREPDTLSQIRKGESFSHAKEISKPFGGIDRVISWCKTAMEDEWRWQLIETSSDIRDGRYIFYFDSERDFFAFTLRWS